MLPLINRILTRFQFFEFRILRPIKYKYPHIDLYPYTRAWHEENIFLKFIGKPHRKYTIPIEYGDASFTIIKSIHTHEIEKAILEAYRLPIYQQEYCVIHIYDKIELIFYVHPATNTLPKS